MTLLPPTDGSAYPAITECVTSSGVALRDVPERFTVAFSLAGEQRELVRPVATEVERILDEQTVFYYEWYQHWTAGLDSDLLLQRIYGEQTELVVLCVCETYGEKSWTQIEHRAIRARWSQLTVSDAQVVLPLRVGEGNIPGIFSTTSIVPDIRNLTPTESAELIIARLNMIRGATLRSRPTSPKWPGRPPELQWPMADHGEARSAFSKLLSESSPARILLVRGITETGKSHMSKQMARNCLTLPGISHGRFDFKGTTDMTNEVAGFCLLLDIPTPGHGTLVEKFGAILAQIRARGRPTVLIFDSYELAGEMGRWIENVLLPCVASVPMVRVVIIGQEVPVRAGATWEAISTRPLSLQMPGPEHWFEYGRTNKGDLVQQFDQVAFAYELAEGRPSILAGLFGPRD